MNDRNSPCHGCGAPYGDAAECGPLCGHCAAQEDIAMRCARLVHPEPAGAATATAESQRIGREWRIGQAVACAMHGASVGDPERVITDRLTHPAYGLTPEQAALAADVAWIVSMA